MHMLRISTATTLPMFTCSRSCCVYAALERERERDTELLILRLGSDATDIGECQRISTEKAPHFMLMFMKTVDEYIHEG